MKKTTIILLLASLSLIYADDFFQYKKYEFISLSPSLPAYDLNVLQKVADNLEMKRFPNLHPCFKLGLVNKKADFGFTYLDVAYPPIKVNPAIRYYFGNKMDIDTAHITSIGIFMSGTKHIKRNAYLFLMSAYSQELDPNFNTNDSLFYKLENKNKSELLKRNWICPALGINYMNQNNPFFSGGFWLQGLYYLDEAMMLSLIIFPPIQSKDKYERIIVPIGGLAGMITFRLLIGHALKIEYNKYELLRNSKYRLPTTITK